MLHLILDVLLHALLLIDLLLFLHVEEDSCRHADGDGVLRFGLNDERERGIGKREIQSNTIIETLADLLTLSLRSRF